ncbi:hypothetical protein CANCADRAFT_128786 [Tortispora caseinolytica NRRL Y-17796]|uniref:E3 ubiquitin ligase complex SCF subunit n=1 Tax=Tortispora caseinolytica NRRL Y-17796 TaxID=767744 RepID=A0A1E4TAM3_9ASCO|nr:hypothetical protein CANCADRAFT_128786 [Tortispora caseinolytica NRRL Y-17796]
MVKLISSDGEQFEVERNVAEQSILIKNVIADIGDDTTEVPVPNVASSVLKKVLEWCEYHKDDPVVAEDEINPRSRNIEIGEWDTKFMQVDQEMLFEIILAANYLDIRNLLEIGCKTVAGMIKRKSPEELRRIFNIPNDFTPEEEAQIRRENEWAEDR